MVPLLLFLLIARLGGASPGVYKSLYSGAHPWPNNTVHYIFDPLANFTTLDKDRVRQALDVISNNTCIEFIEGPSTTYHIKIGSHPGDCGSEAGYTNPFHDPNKTHQGMNLPPGCISSIETPIHEFLHALGIAHSHVRSDRDNYITVHLDDMDAKTRPFYEVGGTNNTTPYDYNSYMHYNGGNPAKPLMEPKDRNYRKAMGSVQGSFYDWHAVNLFHKCYDKCSSTTSVNCSNGGLPHPKDCQKCLCPRGFGGKLCDERPGTCGETFKAEINYRTSMYVEVGNGNVSHLYAKEECVYWFLAPPGHRVKIYLQMETDLAPSGVCGELGWEFKINKDPRRGGPIFCDNDDKGIRFASELNPAPMIVYSAGKYQRFYFLHEAIPIGNDTNVA